MASSSNIITFSRKNKKKVRKPITYTTEATSLTIYKAL